MSKKLLRALRGDVLDVPPVWLMRQAGRYLPEYRELRAKTPDFLELCYTPELAVEVSLQPIRRFGFDAAILFSDILVIPDALGRKVWFEGGVGPRLEEISDEAGIAALDVAGMEDHLAPVFETVSRLAQALPPEVTLIGFAGAPWTVATYMIGGGGSLDQAKARLFAYRYPDLFCRLIDVLVEATAVYLCRQIEAGAEVVQLFDSWAGGLPEAAFRGFVIEPNRRIVERVRRQYPRVPIIGFPRNAGVLYKDFVETIGVDAVSLDTSVARSWARDCLPDNVTLQGNLDPLALLAGGVVLEREVKDIMDMFGERAFIFNLGHGILPETPPEHVVLLLEMIRG